MDDCLSAQRMQWNRSGNVSGFMRSTPMLSKRCLPWHSVVVQTSSGLPGDTMKLEASWMAGYFAPNPGRLVYFHARDIPSARIAARELDRLSISDQEVFDARESLEEFIDQSTAAVVVHEAVHMILHARGIMPANSAVPLWMAEGVAASFEPLEPSRAFGPFLNACGRTRAFREHLLNGKCPAAEGDCRLNCLACR